VTAFLIAVAMSVLSAYIRLSDLGIDCEPWPACYEYSFRTDSEPGITIGNADQFKGLRMTHRFMASAFGVVAILMLILALWYRSIIPSRITPTLVFLLTIVLTVVGMRTPDLPHPSVMLTNTLGGMILGALLLWQYLSLRDKPQLKWAGIAMVLLVTVAIGSGSWVTANFAITACPDLVECTNNISVDALNLSRVLDIDLNHLTEDPSRGTILLIHYLLAGLLLLACLGRIVGAYLRRGQVKYVASSLVVLLMIVALAEPWLRSVLVASLHNLLALLVLLAITVEIRAEHHE